MKYRSRTFDSIDDVPIADWLRVSQNSPSRDFMLPAFIQTVEADSGSFKKFRHVIVYGAGEEPVACASFSLFPLDMTDVVSPSMARFIKGLPRPLSRLFRPLIVICGLPVSLGQSTVAFTAGCDVNEAVFLLDETASRLSDEASAQLILFKEFDVHDAQTLDVLRTRGYSRLETPAVNVFDTIFNSFDEYCEALKSRYRNKIRHSMRKLSAAGAQVQVLTDPGEILSRYTEEVHQLYLAVVAKAEFKLEVLTIEFFRELVRQFPARVELVVIEREGRIVAFNWTFRTQIAYHFLFAGVDYRLNRQLDLYFNIMFAAFAAGLRTGLGKIEVGQTADEFKARLGCTQRRLYAFARGTRWDTACLIRYGQRFFLPMRAAPSFNIFKPGARVPEQ